jgi:hypothetical protein
MEINYLKAGFFLIVGLGCILFNAKSIRQIPKKIKQLF